MIFFILPSGAYTNKSKDFALYVQATCSCLCRTYGFSKFSPHICSYYPCDFLWSLQMRVTPVILHVFIWMWYRIWYCNYFKHYLRQKQVLRLTQCKYYNINLNDARIYYLILFRFLLGEFFKYFCIYNNIAFDFDKTIRATAVTITRAALLKHEICAPDFFGHLEIIIGVVLSKSNFLIIGVDSVTEKVVLIDVTLVTVSLLVFGIFVGSLLDDGSVIMSLLVIGSVIMSLLLSFTNGELVTDSASGCIVDGSSGAPVHSFMLEW